MKQTITRKTTFDSGHRVMNERMKCFNLHGHTYILKMSFSFTNMRAIGYPIDFKEIKRVACQFIDDYFDHGMIINPHDHRVIELCNKEKSKYWIMTIGGKDKIGDPVYCNPTVENIARELWCALSMLMDSKELKLSKIKLWETPNCYTTCRGVDPNEYRNFIAENKIKIEAYKVQKGIINYDDREQ